MNKKNTIKIIPLFFIIIILLIVYGLQYFNNFTSHSLEYKLQMIPFRNDNNLIRLNVNLKISRKLPKIEAASAFYSFAANLVENIYDKNEFNVDDLKLVSTSKAYSDIANDKCDFIIASSPSEEQIRLLNESNKKFEYYLLYYEPLVIYVNANNKIENINIDEIKKYYYGDENTYNTYQLEKNNGSQTCFESIVNNNILSNKHIELKSMPSIIDKVGEDKNGIGYSFYSYYSKMYLNENKTQIVKVDNKSIYDNEYPLLFEVYLIYNKDNINENMSKIIDFLKSEEGNRLIQNCK